MDTIGPMWFGNTSYVSNRKFSLDGKTFSNKREIILFGTYFFLSNELVIHQISVSTIFDLIAKHGGLTSTVFGLALALGSYVNSRLFMGYIISESFIVQGMVDHENNHKRNKIVFSVSDKFS